MEFQAQIRKISTVGRGVAPTCRFRAEKWCATGLAFVLALLLPGPLAAEGGLSEYQVKAAFLLNFTRFIEWPAGAFENPDSPFSVCILGDDPFGGTLDQVVEGESVNGRRITVQRIRRAPRPRSCQVLFISRSEKDVSGVLDGLGGGVLTVSDRDGFLREGGTIAFVLDGRHVRFDISLRAAASASLILNARLLNVARSVQK